jgi:predicted PurR-regulated permease PerM
MPANFALIGLLMLAALYASSQMVPILMALILAMMFKLMLEPIVEGLRRIGVPRMLSALVLVVGLPCLGAYALAPLTDPVGDWLQSAPRTFDRVERRLVPLIKPLRNARQAADAVNDLTAVPGQHTEVVHVAEPNLLDRFASRLPSLVLGFSVTTFVTFFLLASGDAFQRKLATTGRSFAQRRRMIGMIRQIEAEVGRYLRTITAINVALGVATACLMWALGLAEPWMWGALAAILNFAPYLGPMTVIVALGLTGLASSDSLTSGLIPAASFLALATVEGQIITPAILGHRMSLSPLLVFIGVVFAGFLWGGVGALVAVPLLVAARIVFEHIDSMHPVAVMMGTPGDDRARILQGKLPDPEKSDDTNDTTPVLPPALQEWEKQT